MDALQSSLILQDENSAVVNVQVRRFTRSETHDVDDEVAVEEPFEIRIAGRSIAMIMRTPGADRSLAAGFLFAERLVERAADVAAWSIGLDRDGFPDRNVVDVRLRQGLDVSNRFGERHFAVSSSCGVCGKASIEAARLDTPPVLTKASIATDVLLGLEATLRDGQVGFCRTGGLHAAGAFTLDGELLATYEDVGRHNAVDKVIGQLLIEGRVPGLDAVLLVSGRASFELIQKSAIAGIPIFAAVGAPSSLAIDLAIASEMTLVGLLRPGRFVVYSRPDRIAADPDD